MKPKSLLLLGGTLGILSLAFLSRKPKSDIGKPRLRYPSPTERDEAFGPLEWTRVPKDDRVLITNDFEEKLVTLETPELSEKNPRLPSRLTLHKDAAPVFHRFFKDLESRGLLELIDSVDGAFVARRVHGKDFLSSHAYGTAIDLNAPQNPVGSDGSPENQELAKVALEHGLFWGGHFMGQKDPMHFEVVPQTFDHT